MDFYYGGYGGFGYDTSGIRPDESESQLKNIVGSGNLQNVKSLCEQKTFKNETVRREFLNKARKWTEVDYKDSGFSKEYEWYDLTPLACAARYGHVEIVEYLLREFADPTLNGCPTDNVHFDAFGAAERGLKEKGELIKKILNLTPESIRFPYDIHTVECWVMGNEPAEEIANKLLEVEGKFRHCSSMLQAVKNFWKSASYSHSSSSSDSRKKTGYSNQPTDKSALCASLDEFVNKSKESNTEEYNPEIITQLSSQIEMIRSRSNEMKREEEMKLKKEEDQRKKEEDLRKEKAARKRVRKAEKKMKQNQLRDRHMQFIQEHQCKSK